MLLQSEMRGNSEKPPGVPPGQLCQGFPRHAAYLRDGVERADEVGGRVHGSPLGRDAVAHGGDVGRIRLDQEPVFRHGRGPRSGPGQWWRPRRWWLNVTEPQNEKKARYAAS